MEWKQFVESCTRTESHLDEDVLLDLTLLINTLKLNHMSGKLLDMLKKRMFYGDKREVDVEQFKTILQGMIGICFKTDTEVDIFGYCPTLPTKVSKRLIHGIVGMAGEAGELSERLVIMLERGEPSLTDEDVLNIMEECSDSDWYKSVTFDELGLDERDARQKLVNKLRVRYGDKFDADAAYNRDLEAEKRALQGG